MATSKLFLYDSPASPFAQIVRMVLREKSLAFTTQPPADFMRASPTGAFATANPKAEVPTLIDGETAIYGSGIIAEYLEDKWPQPPLFPADPAAKARVRITAEAARNQYEAVNWALLELRFFGRAEGELAARIEKNAVQATRTLQEWFSQRLGTASYFSGSEFGFADICVAPVLERSVFLGLGPAEGSSLHQWLERVKQRPSVRETFEEAAVGLQGLSKMGGVFKMPGQERKREYRDHRLDFLIKAGGLDIVAEGIRDNNIRFSWPQLDG